MCEKDDHMFAPPETVEETVPDEIDLSSDESRRDFITKMAGAAGAIAAAGLLTGALSSGADAAEVAPRSVGAIQNGAAALKCQTLQNGFSMRLSGKDIGQVLAREGLVPTGAAQDKMGIGLVIDFQG